MPPAAARRRREPRRGPTNRESLVPDTTAARGHRQAHLARPARSPRPAPARPTKEAHVTTYKSFLELFEWKEEHQHGNDQKLPDTNRLDAQETRTAEPPDARRGEQRPARPQPRPPQLLQLQIT